MYVGARIYSRGDFPAKFPEQIRGGSLADEHSFNTRLAPWFVADPRQSDPGIGNFELERVLGCPAEHLEFHVWYLKEKGWIKTTESGTLAITVEGVDRANRNPRQKLVIDER